MGVLHHRSEFYLLHARPTICKMEHRSDVAVRTNKQCTRYPPHSSTSRPHSLNFSPHAVGRYQCTPINQLRPPSSRSNCVWGIRRSPVDHDTHFELGRGASLRNILSDASARSEETKLTYASVLSKKPSTCSNFHSFSAKSKAPLIKSNPAEYTSHAEQVSRSANRKDLSGSFSGRHQNGHQTSRQPGLRVFSEVRRTESDFRRVERARSSTPSSTGRAFCNARPRSVSSRDLQLKLPSRWNENANCVHSTNTGRWLATYRTSNLPDIIPFSEFHPLMCATPKDKLNKSKPSGHRSSRRSLSASACKSSTSASDSSPSVKKFNTPLLLPIDDLINSKAESHPPSAHAAGGLSYELKLAPIKETTRIGKVREVPKAKRPSRLKRTILTEREARKLRSHSAPVRRADTLFDSSVAVRKEDEATVSVSLHKTDSIQFSVNGLPDSNSIRATPQEELLISNLLTQLAQFQDRAFVKFANVPMKRNRAKRFVCGLREVIKHLRLKHVRLIILARDLEGNAVRRCERLNTSEPLGKEDSNLPILEKTIVQIWELTRSTDPSSPILIAHNRRKLAYLCHKPGKVSVIGILSFAGAEQTGDELLSLRSTVNLSSQYHLEGSEYSVAKTRSEAS